MINPQTELETIIKRIREDLTDLCLFHVCEIDEDNPFSYTVAAYDDNGYVNSGLVGWSHKDNKVYYIAYNAERANRDEMEGIPLDESRCWGDTFDYEVFLMHLNGEARELVRNWSKILQHQNELDNA